MPGLLLYQQALRCDFLLKDKSGVHKIIVRKQLYQLLNTNREFFASFDASSFHTMNLRKLGQISSPFCILYECE